MTDILLPTWLEVARVQFSYKGNNGVSPSVFGGIARTSSLNAARLQASMEYTTQGGGSRQMERAALISFFSDVDDKSNRAWMTIRGHVLRGSFPAAELLSNNTFANGTTGWASFGPTFNVSERIARITRTQGSTAIDLIGHPQVTGLTQYAPYVVRSFDSVGRGTWISGPQLGSSAGVNDYVLGGAAGSGMKTSVAVVPATSAHFSLVDLQATNTAGDYLDVPYVSMSRCALADAGVNLLTRSDEFDNAAWTKVEATISANAGVAPDNTTTADAIVDNANNTAHFVQQGFSIASTALDYCLTVAVKASARNFVAIEMATATGTASLYCNLTTGATSSVGVTLSFSNARAAVTDLGLGWFRISLVARKTSSETVLTGRIYAANVAGSAAYAGAGTSAILVWRATLSQSGVAARQVQTTSSTIAPGSASSLQRGSTLHLKGLPPSTNGLLLKNDVVEVITAGGSEPKIVTQRLDSDASGLGYLQFKPPLRQSPSDNAAVIIHEPFGRFMFMGESPSWSNEPGLITNASAEFIEA